MLFGSPLLAATSRNGSASPDERKADSSCAECMTDFTRYGSRAGGLVELIIIVRFPPASVRSGRHDYEPAFRAAQRQPRGADPPRVVPSTALPRPRTCA